MVCYKHTSIIILRVSVVLISGLLTWRCFPIGVLCVNIIYTRALHIVRVDLFNTFFSYYFSLNFPFFFFFSSCSVRHKSRTNTTRRRIHDVCVRIIRPIDNNYYGCITQRWAACSPYEAGKTFPHDEINFESYTYNTTFL